ncbi:MAG: hypothetical protein DWP98_06235 [Bacteroidetes bacterium]|nr:MAG: hypothetical protein DWP98_06235 [Bacteroidota bacterium]MBL1145202.1 hypothetical protein [Bacteroidota bacterium]MCB0802934.1 ZIP family metal transporter [Flavobacteriales bacterium]NOG57998.1 ZIP family metal transporter [Bacteroidota bacterium]
MFINYILLFAVGMISGLFAFRFKSLISPYISSLLSFSGAYLISICFLHLLPDVFQGNESMAGLFILIGFFLQLILDYFSGGIEHGHAHVNKLKIGQFPWLVLLSLCLHAFLESIPINHVDHGHGFGAYLIGLLIHKGPIAFILASLLIAYKISNKSIWFGITLFSIMGPLGLFIGKYIEGINGIFQALMGLSIGIILHLSTTILFETNEEHKIEWKKVLPMLLGASLGLLTLFTH